MSVEYVLKKSPAPASAQIDYRGALNDEQFSAVTAKPGPLLVIAGAGSGKTRTLTYRVAYLIENGVEPENILLLTFTNKASREMLHRVGALLPRDISRIWGGTFHSVANKLLRRHANELGFSGDFTILDRDDAADLALAALKSAGLDPKDKTLPKGAVLLDLFGLAANMETSLASIVASHYPYFTELLPKLEIIQRLFQEQKKADNVMDYDDLLVYALRLLQQSEPRRKFYQQQFQHILVDEYQDTNKIQADFIDLLAAGHHQVMAVGDDAQSIYSWRGANFANVLTFPERFPGTRHIRIETNYRSTPEILALANQVISENTRQFKKNLHAVRPAAKHPKPALITLQTANQQAQFICQRIGELHQDEGVELDEIAILYRAHFHSMEIQMEMTRQNIPFELLSGLRFFEQAHVKDVSAFLKFALNPKDQLAFLRIAKLLPGIGEKSAERLWDQLKNGASLDSLTPPVKAASLWSQFMETHRQLTGPELRGRASEQIQAVIDALYEDYMKTKFPNYTSRLEDLGQLRAFAQNFERTEEFLAQLALLTNLDGGPRTETRGPAEPTVRLSTIHQAKGLEWKAVFVIMLCDGLFPSARSLEDLEDEEEERRLFYVAVTRAKDELYLSYPLTRASAAFDDRWQEPSRFITALPKGLVNEWKIKGEEPSWE